MSDTPVTWKVMYQQEGYDTTPGAPIVKGVTVGFIVNDSVQSSVFVSAADYTADKVKPIIDAAAKRVWAVQSLTHQG
jgi:hypothetical protein